MSGRLGFSDFELTTAKKQTKREIFLSEIAEEVPTMRRIAGIELINDCNPDATAILTFRHLLEKHELANQIYCFAEVFVYATVKAHLSNRGMTMRQGTIVDATLIAAPSSTFTRARPECAGGSRTRRGSRIRRCTRPRRATSGTKG